MPHTTKTLLLITLATAVSHAQTWTSPTWDLTGWDLNTIGSTSGQTFDVFGDSSLNVNVKGVIDAATTASTITNGISMDIPGSAANEFNFTLDQASGVSFGIFDVATSGQEFLLNANSTFTLGNAIGANTFLGSPDGANGYAYQGVGGIWTNSDANDITSFTLYHWGGANSETASFTFQSVVPEPSSIALLTLATSTLLLSRKRTA